MISGAAMADQASRDGGLLHSIRAGIAALNSGLQTRLALAATEVEEEGERVKQTLILTLLMFFGLGFGIILLTIFIVVLFWEGGLVYAVGCLAVLYVGIGMAAGLMLRKTVRGKPRLFSATLGELAKDRDRFRRASRE